MRFPIAGLVALAITALIAASAPGSRAAAGDTGCTANYGRAAPRPSNRRLRFGIDPGLAGSVGTAQQPTVPDDPAQDVAFSKRLRPTGRVLVVRLNRLFWSGGQPLIDRFRALVARYVRAGLDVELQVRYHPPAGRNGDLRAWTAYVRHVVDVFGPDRHVVAMTITNEVNIAFSPNTSDGGYASAPQALIDGIEAAHAEAVKRHDSQLRFGFTYAYRFSPTGDTGFFRYLGAHGGRAFRRALDYVGVDVYPGSIYPPAPPIGQPVVYRADLAQALGAVRDCFMPMAGLKAAVPIWITEDGIPTRPGITEAQQARGLTQLIAAARAYARTFNVTDYRWFNLRDSIKANPNVAPGLFATDGLLHADYSPKPAYAAYRAAIAAYGRRTASGGARPR